jgi:hypothetical protein
VVFAFAGLEIRISFYVTFMMLTAWSLAWSRLSLRVISLESAGAPASHFQLMPAFVYLSFCRPVANLIRDLDDQVSCGDLYRLS